MRTDGRAPEEKRPVSIETDFVRTAYGSCLIATGNTRVICTASVEDAVPPFLKGKASGAALRRGSLCVPSVFNSFTNHRMFVY